MTLSLSLKKKVCILLLSAALLSGMISCSQIDDDRVPSMPVYINLGDAGMWNTYGVAGVGLWRNFINSGGVRMPSDFPYTANSYTGFGGVLLIGGVDPFTSDPNVPLAYDLSCPVERSQTVRVSIDSKTLEAVCPKCGSHYDVVVAGGSPVSGPAFEGKHKYGLRRYVCDRVNGYGYIIHN